MMKRLAPLFLLMASTPAFASGDMSTEDTIFWICLHAINLTLLLSVLIYFLRDKLRAALAARAGAVKQDFDAAASAQKEASLRLTALEKRLKGFQAELVAMRAESRTAAENEKELIIARADRDAGIILDVARRTITAESSRARAALKAEAAALAVDLAGKRIKKDIKAKDNTRLADAFLGAVQDGHEVRHG
jgi:F-type H+-transporting ATPase subunit b